MRHFFNAYTHLLKELLSSILFYSILFYSILFYSILFYSILFYFNGCPRSIWSSQVRGRIRARTSSLHHSHSNWIRAALVTYTTAHGNAASLTHWTRPGIEPAYTWTLCCVLNPLSHSRNFYCPYLKTGTLHFRDTKPFAQASRAESAWLQSLRFMSFIGLGSKGRNNPKPQTKKW